MRRPVERVPCAGETPQHADRDQRFQDRADAGAGIGEQVHRQCRLRQLQQRKAVEELADEHRRQDPRSEDQRRRYRNARRGIDRADLRGTDAEKHDHQPGDAVGDRDGEVEQYP